MITIPSTTKTGFPVRRVGLFHGGGVGSTLVMYHLMKDIIDRSLDVTLNVCCLDKPGDPVWNVKDAHFGVSSALKCQKLLNFDSDKLIVQVLEPHRSLDSEDPLIFRVDYWGWPNPTTPNAPLVKRNFRQIFNRAQRIHYLDFDSEGGELFESAAKDNLKWESNVLYRPLHLQLLDADSDGDTVLADSIIEQYKDSSVFYSLMCQCFAGYNMVDVMYEGEYRNAPESVQNNFHSDVGLNSTRPESVRGLNADVDSELVSIDSDAMPIYLPTDALRHWWVKRPLLSVGDARDLYNNYYSQDSDLETLFWYTMSCNHWWRRRYFYEEIHSAPYVKAIYDSDSILFDKEADRYIYQIRQQPLHKFIPHCRTCWPCQNRAYGFEAWLDSEDTAAWLRTESVFNPPLTPAPTDAIVVYDFSNGGSLPGTNEADVRNLGSIDGIGSIVGDSHFYDSDNEVFLTGGSTGNHGILSQNIRPYVDSDGKMSISIWFETVRTTGTIVADLPNFTDTSNYTGILEMGNGTIYAGFANSLGTQSATVGTIDSDTLVNVILTFDGSTFKSFLNGVQKSQDSFTREHFSQTELQIELGFGNSNLYANFGELEFSDNASNDLLGKIKKFSYYNRALSDDEVSSLYDLESFNY